MTRGNRKAPPLSIGVPRFELETSPTRPGAAGGADIQAGRACSCGRRKRPGSRLEQRGPRPSEALLSGCPDLNWGPLRSAQAPPAAPTSRPDELARAAVGNDRARGSNKEGLAEARPFYRGAQI